MKIDYKKMDTKKLFILTDGDKPKKDSDIIELLKKCGMELLRAQSARPNNTLGESWAADAIFDLIDCLQAEN